MADEKKADAAPKRSSGGSVAAVEATDPIEPDSVDEEPQATEEAPAGGTPSEKKEDPAPESPAPEAPTGGQSFDYGRRPWEE